MSTPPLNDEEKLLALLKPDAVIVLKDGVIEKTGGPSMVKEVFREGFEKKE